MYMYCKIRTSQYGTRLTLGQGDLDTLLCLLLTRGLPRFDNNLNKLTGPEGWDGGHNFVNEKT